MIDYATFLSGLTRPRLLIRAARAGSTRYNRAHHLRMVAKIADGVSHEELMSALILSETEMEEIRRSGSADYNVHRHVHILTALLAEMRAAGPKLVVAA